LIENVHVQGKEIKERNEKKNRNRERKLWVEWLVLREKFVPELLHAEGVFTSQEGTAYFS